ncbi:MAG: signal peptidase II, partial [Syntrophobacteraceae bacterium CG07_land_8_20_14_0_80_61_8]
MKKWNLVLLISSGIVILDQLTKFLVVRSFKLYESIIVINGFFNITYLRNKGAAFSFLADSNSSFILPFFIITTLAAIGVILYLIYEEGESHPFYLPSLSMVLGGALGNLIDRIFRGGEVVD